jgi:hypothetical protein
VFRVVKKAGALFGASVVSSAAWFLRFLSVAGLNAIRRALAFQVGWFVSVLLAAFPVAGMVRSFRVALLPFYSATGGTAVSLSNMPGLWFFILYVGKRQAGAHVPRHPLWRVEQTNRQQQGLDARFLVLRHFA